MNMNNYQGWLKTAIVCCLFFIFTFCAFAQAPQTPVREVTDEYFGQKIVDPYRWLEDQKSAESAAWMKAQNDYARSILDKLPMRDELLKRISELSNSNLSVSGLQRVGNLYFYYKLAPGENDRKIYVRSGLSGAERLLVDPQKLSASGKRYSIDTFTVSQDGKYLSYTASIGGSENGEMRVIEVASGRDTGERIDRARFGAGSWLPDGKSFVYSRLQKLAPDAPVTELYQKSRVYLHTLGTNPDDDKPVFGYEVNPEIKTEPAMLSFSFIPPGSKYALAIINSGVSPNSVWFIAPVSSLNQSPVPWKKLADLDDEVQQLDFHGDDLYLLTYKNAPRYKIIKTSLSQPNMAKAQTIFPAGETVVTGLLAAKDALYVQTLDGGIGRLWRMNFAGGAPQAVKFPFEGSIQGIAFDPRETGLIIGTQSWTKSPVLYQYDPANGKLTDTKLQPASPVDFSGIEAVSAKAKSYDGTMIPLSIIYKKGTKLDGKNPLLMDGYGAYGITNNSPYFNAESLAWLERGGILAVTGVRGGGEYGEEWHLAGKLATKPNTWKDFIACAEYLIAQKYTSPEHLGIIGGSAGGILISNTITTRPELFGAAIIAVGANNMMRMETTSNGVPNIPEFGTFKTEEGFKALLAMDGYLKVKDGVKYPAVLLTHGINDPRVEPWMSAKMAARLQAATASGKPVILRIDYDAGHGFGSTKKQQNEQTADIYAFLFAQLGK